MNTDVSQSNGTGSLEADDATKLYRFPAIVFVRHANQKFVEVRSPSPLHVLDYADQVIGSAYLEDDGSNVVAHISLRYDCPERLDLENKEKVFVEPVSKNLRYVTLRYEDGGTMEVPSVLEISSLHLLRDSKEVPRVGE